MNWLKNFTGKDMATIITAAGGVVLAGFAIYFYAQSNQSSRESMERVTGQHILRNTEALTELVVVIRANSDIQKETKEVVNANTSFWKSIFNRK